MKINKLIMLIVLILNIGIISVKGDLTDGLIAYYSFDINGSDDFKNYDPIANTATHFDSGGIIGGYYNTSNTKYIDYLHDSGEPLGGISMWVKDPDGFANLPTFRYFAEFGNAFMYVGEGSGGDTADEVFGFFNPGGSNMMVEELNSDWHHVVITWNNSKYQYYIDGEAKVTYTQPASEPQISTWDSESTIGTTQGRAVSTSSAFDEIALYNRTIIYSEVTSLYNGGSGLNPTIDILSLSFFSRAPANGSVLNESTNFTYSVTLANYSANCTIYVNESLILTVVDIAEGVYDIQLNTTDFNNEYNTINITCFDFNNTVSEEKEIFYNDTAPESAINIVFNYQQPSDVIYYDILGQTINVSYNITSVYPLTNVTLLGEHSPGDECDVFVNGVCAEIRNYNYTSVVNDTYIWQFEDVNYLPTIFQVEPDYFEGKEILTYTLDSTVEYLKLTFKNYSVSKNISILGVMANTSESAPLNVFYCNESYTTGNPSTSDYCVLVDAISATPGYDHIHDENNSHNSATWTSNGLVGDVGTTSTCYILFGSAGDWEFKYVDGSPESGITQITNNGGNTWSTLNWQFNVHLHQLDLNQSVLYNITATDNLNYSVTSEAIEEPLDIGNLPPSTVEILNPISFTLPIVNTINYTASTSPNLYSVGNYSISIFNANFELVEVIKEDNGDLLYYFYDFGSIPYGLYYLQVNATDVLGQSSSSFSTEVLTVGTTTTTTTIYVPTTTLLPIDPSGDTHQFQSVEQALFYILLFGLWIVFYYATFNLKGESGQGVGFMNILQMIVAISIGLSFGRFNWLIGYGVMLVGVGTFIGKILYGKT